MALFVDGFHGDGGPNHDHHHRARRLALGLLFHAGQCTDHGDPTVCTQAGGMVITIDQARLF
jgi:hypothetical protein